MSKINEAINCFQKGFSCSQSICSTYGPLFNVNTDTCLKISSAFGGGMGLMQKTCGAVTGAFLIIGLKYGSTDSSNTDSKELVYSTVKKFNKKFKERNSTIDCSELLKMDITTDKGLAEAREKNIFIKKCSKYVKDAAEIIEEILLID